MALKDERSPKYAFPEAGTSPSEISYKKLAIRLRFTFLIRFSMLATGSLLAAALLPLLLLLLMLLEP